ncbi:thiamine pyrophosphate-requiring protein [Cellulomonas sp. zg-ZUI222]|uniref:Thiamine pyrophosphate-requiring protein n=1 Tax=Cellulomonas wangleii TaxID=2816956 RepID=A0ABX8D6Q7_9CELL|nr:MULTISPECIES: thiamine pyrophosphate-requiring protein [Cellulomonas]MBO0901155.1 thiamine pyrophosphate-requiring protein [Cellulomonas sp. zg-ZUI22]MBO0922533.1 thiamine pyrophosphate-requiring protein [Cellulomonas wangleii]MBO0926762.1 thiamine pyrophosphate-requiring protein [Cellulomonas wangleii]QVI63129.1 thiamine pyrophosphate-requiring protein [Cellulomonas wangleii]
MTTVADAIVRRLGEWGVERIFGYAGDGIDPLLAALARAGGDIELVTARHEEMAAFMATGHAKYSGGVGVCLATQGPGAIHLLTGLYDAKLDRTPVVAVVGQVATTALGTGYLQEVDLPVLLKDVCAQYLQTVTTPEQLPAVLDAALRTAIATSSPTCVIVPHDVQQAVAAEPEQSHGVVQTSRAVSRTVGVPPGDDLDRAAQVLGAGERVVVLAGRGARGATDQVLEVVERLGAGLVTSLLGKPLFDEGLPMHAGVMGHLGTTASADLLARCDTLLIVGSSDPWTEFYPPLGQARTVQVDVAARNLGAKYPVEAPLAGDAAATLDALLPRLPQRSGPWRDEVTAAVASWRRIAAERVAAPAEPLNPQLLLHELSAHLPADAQVSVDVGSITYWYARHLRLPPGVPAHLSSTLASMGSALPYGIAAKLLHPERPVVALAGDGAMLMNGINELVTVAARWRDWADPRFVVLVLDNGDLAEVTWEQREMEGDPRFDVSQDVPSFPYADYAELLGLAAVRVDDPADVADAWRTALAADRPCVVQAVVDRDTPLLPPRAPAAQVERMRRGLSQEPVPDNALRQLQAQRSGERADDPAGLSAEHEG